jgi:hypothetical protein
MDWRERGAGAEGKRTNEAAYATIASTCPKGASKCHETNETSAEISLKPRASYMNPDKRFYSLGEDSMSTFLFLALSSAFLLGMVAGALTRRIAD